MKKVFHKVISLGVVFVMLFSMTATALAASNNTYAEDADELYGIFDDIANESDLKKDSDSDGINDYFEKEMSAGRLRLGTGVPLIGTDYLNADSDGDSLTDGEEMSVEKTKKLLGFLGSEKVYVRLYSNPTSMDTDKDGILDAEDERPLYVFGFNYLGSKAHLKSVEEQMTLRMQDAYLYGDNITNIYGNVGDRNSHGRLL